MGALHVESLPDLCTQRQVRFKIPVGSGRFRKVGRRSACDDEFEGAGTLPCRVEGRENSVGQKIGNTTNENEGAVVPHPPEIKSTTLPHGVAASHWNLKGRIIICRFLKIWVNA